MATSSLCIKRAHRSCTAEIVKEQFERHLEDDEIIHQVDELEKTDAKSGEVYKMFFIHFAHNNTILNHVFSQIESNGHHILNYGTRFDKKKDAHVNVFWQIYAFKPKPKNTEFKPGFFTPEQALEAGIKS